MEVAGNFFNNNLAWVALLVLVRNRQTLTKVDNCFKMEQVAVFLKCSVFAKG